MAATGNVWITRHQGQWAVKLEGTDEPKSVHATQADAIDQARELAKQNKSELLIQGEDGRIRERNTYGVDPGGSAG